MIWVDVKIGNNPLNPHTHTHLDLVDMLELSFSTLTSNCLVCGKCRATTIDPYLGSLSYNFDGW